MNQSSPALEGESQDETEEFNHTDLRRGVKGFPGGSVVKKKKKKSACSAGDTGETGSIPGWRRSPGRGDGNLLQYSCLGNPMDRRAWQNTVRGVTKSQTGLTMHAMLH